ncbi:hypothetical protein MIZ03_4776 [Rhodoferax lithotrophicus]|uniref:Phosphoglycerate mutase n=1 Tax=Rhodoferax lithotrophicus TaxID=2798804 RepID=A0ABM7MTX3_9BURK|nr:histidine phosphatase family protein [Rhodoferax sp. MIZ03]BCO29852.1 hypothetical protein MIZ03_4776 [Rhodoferax sp. MIZ03]
MTCSIEKNALCRTIRQLQTVPKTEPVAMLVRHSIRDGIPDGTTGIDVPLNELGIYWCHELRKAMHGRIKSVHSSPVRRCMQTAEILTQSATNECLVSVDRHLGAPGVYVLDEQMSWGNWLKLGNDGVIQHLISGEGALPGMADPSEAAHRLIKHMLASIASQPGMHVFVSHDSIVAPTVARVIGQKMTQNQWPEFLDAALIWRNENFIMVAYRDTVSQTLIDLPGR